jgi:hypothetical protein
MMDMYLSSEYRLTDHSSAVAYGSNSRIHLI